MERLWWFPLYPQKLLGGLIGLRWQEQHVYMIILLRIYDVGGPCPDDIERLALLTRQSRKQVARCVDRLVQLGKLIRTDGGLMNRFAEETLASMQAVAARQKRAGKIAADARWKNGTEKSEQNQTEVDANRMRSDAHLHLHKQEQVKKEVSNPPVVPPRGRAHRLPDDFKLSPEMETYAGEHSLNASDLFAPFCDHHRAKGNAMVDWTAAWRTWVRNEVKFSKNRMNGNGHAPRPGSKEDSRERTQAALAAFAPNDGTYDVRTGPRAREPLFEIIPPTQLGKP